MSSSSLSGFTETAQASLARASRFLLDLFKSIDSRIGQDNKQTVYGCTIALVSVQLYYWYKFSFWSRRGVRTPRPVPFFGNYHSFFTHAPTEIETEWPKKYGKVYGYYIGSRPVLVVADAKVLKQISIKDFDLFVNRYFLSTPNKYQKNFLITQQDDHWRGLRAILTPTFSSGRIKTFFKVLNSCCDDLISSLDEMIDESQGDSVQLNSSRTIMSSYSMSSSVASFYGIKLQTKLNVDSGKELPDSVEMFARKSNQAFVQEPIRLAIGNVVPDSILKFFGFTQIEAGRMEFFETRARRILEARAKSDHKANDYLQLLTDARDGHSADKAVSDNAESHHALDINREFRPSKMRLTEDEVICQAMMLIMVATETTSVLMNHTCYLLAQHPEHQEKLFDELMKIKLEGTKDGYEYDQLTSCVYLDSVISETLRLMSPALFLDRLPSEDYLIEDYNITVPKGTQVLLAFYAIHHDPDYWPEPDKFIPSRFFPENKSKIVSGSYCPFGIGPRACIGYRFALTEAKVGIARMVSHFEIKKVPNLVLKARKPSFILNVQDNMGFILERRK